MNAKYKIALLALISCLLLNSNKEEYSNELVRYEKLPIDYSKYNFDGYNDFVDLANKYYNAFLTYIDFSYFKGLELSKGNTNSYQGTSLFYLDDVITFNKSSYSLSIHNKSNYISFDLVTSSSFYLYFSSSYLDLRKDNIIYFIKDKYRVCIENKEIKSILSYEENYYFENNLFVIKDDKLVKHIDQNKTKELETIAKIYLTEYF